MSQKGKSKNVNKSKEPSIEEIYQNKNFLQPKEKTFETIYEEPKVSRDGKEHLTSVKKYKRFLLFEDYPTTTKLRKRRERAKKLASNKKYPKRLTRARNKESYCSDKSSALDLNLDSNNRNCSFLELENSNVLAAETSEWKMPCLSEDSEDNSNSVAITTEKPNISVTSEMLCDSSIKVEELCKNFNEDKESYSIINNYQQDVMTEKKNIICEHLQTVNHIPSKSIETYHNSNRSFGTPNNTNKSVEIDCNSEKSVETDCNKNRSLETECNINRSIEINCNTNRSVETDCNTNRSIETNSDINRSFETYHSSSNSIECSEPVGIFNCTNESNNRKIDANNSLDFSKDVHLNPAQKNHPDSLLESEDVKITSQNKVA